MTHKHGYRAGWMLQRLIRVITTCNHTRVHHTSMIQHAIDIMTCRMNPMPGNHNHHLYIQYSALLQLPYAGFRAGLLNMCSVLTNLMGSFMNIYIIFVIFTKTWHESWHPHSWRWNLHQQPLSTCATGFTPFIIVMIFWPDSTCNNSSEDLTHDFGSILNAIVFSTWLSSNELFCW